MRNLTVEELDSFTDEELSIYDSDEPQPGQPGVWLPGIESSARDFARYEAWRRRNAIDRMTDFDYDEFLEREKNREAAAKRVPWTYRQHRGEPKTLAQWLEALPPMKQTGRDSWNGPCPICADGENRLAVKEKPDGKVADNPT